MPFWNRRKEPAVPQQKSAKIHPAAQAAQERMQAQSARSAPIASRAVPPALERVRAIIAIASGKGGVGKSTVASNLAVALQKRGARVGLLDADIYGPTQTGLLGSGRERAEAPQGMLEPLDRHGVKFMSMGLLMPHDGPVVWRAPMATRAVQQFIAGVSWGELDYLLIDLPPGTGDVQLTLAQQAALTGAVIVTTPQEIAVGIAKKGLKMFQQLNVPILGIIENMSGFTCTNCGHETAIFHHGGGARMARELQVPFLGSLPLDPAVMMSGESGMPVLSNATDTPAARAIEGLASALEARLKELSGSADGEPREMAIGPRGDLMVQWPDGFSGAISPYQLRVSCGCASCIDEHSGRKILDPARVPLDIAIRGIEPVGRYAITAQFSDGHSTGIYPFKKLRELSAASSSAKEESFSV